jgi:spermidine/putrescine ABC transporter ATP-binding subunit
MKELQKGKLGARIELRKLEKNFDGVRAVDGISLRIEAGEFLTLLGPSGSGKTTTLNLIAGFEVPTSGEIFLGEEDIAAKPPHKRNLGMVFQNYALFPHMRVSENIAFPLRNRGVPEREIRSRVQSVLSLVKLEGYEKRYPKQLSGGQQQRVALARSLVYHPQALLMDEPLGALDKKLREHMQIEIKRIQKETGITMIYVTHDQEEALNMSDRIGVMNCGRIEQIGSSRQIYEWPQNRFVADFIGSANIIEGRVVSVESSGARVAVWDGLEVTALNPMKKIVGQSVHVLVRPERIVIVRENAQAENRLSGTVWEASYIGELIRYIVDFGGGKQMILKEHNIGQTIAAPGSRICISWRCSDALVV